MKLSNGGTCGLRVLSDVAVHQSEEPVPPAEKDYELGIRTTKAL
jgi:hypothetical protein